MKTHVLLWLMCLESVKVKESALTYQLGVFYTLSANCMFAQFHSTSVCVLTYLGFRR